MIAFKELLTFLDAHGLKYQVDNNEKLVAAGFTGKNTKFHAFFKLDEDWGLLQIFATVPVVVPDGCRTAIAETVVRGNYGMILGKFEMDFSDGELRFQIANCFSGGFLDEDIMHRMLGTAIRMVDSYFPAFTTVVYANELPKDAVDQVRRSCM